MGKVMITGKISQAFYNQESNSFIYKIKDYPNIVSNKLIPIAKNENRFITIEGYIKKRCLYSKITCHQCQKKTEVLVDNSYILLEEYYIFDNLSKCVINNILLEGIVLKINNSYQDVSYLVLSNLNKYLVISNDNQSFKDNIFLSISQKIRIQGIYSYEKVKKSKECLTCGSVFTYTIGMNVVHSKESKIVFK